jgi:hypothetical protein
MTSAHTKQTHKHQQNHSANAQSASGELLIRVASVLMHLPPVGLFGASCCIVFFFLYRLFYV